MFPRTDKRRKIGMISFRLRTKWQKCRGYVPRYERTPKNGWFDIHSVFATHVETVALLTRQNPKLHLELEIDSETFDFSKIKRKVTYQEIKRYIEVKTGQKVHTAYIAQVKDAYGLKTEENHRPSKKAGYEPHKCPKDKWILIEEALKHFNMI